MKNTIKNLTPKLQEIFAHLHTNPELSWKENNTTSYIQSLFASEACRITTFLDMTGIVIEIGSGTPVVALRADMDALWQEVDGTFRGNHSCGHDAHMTIVIGTLLTLLKSDLPQAGTFRFIFQPAEEKGTGALAMVEKGVVDDVDFLYGMHLRPKEELPDGKFAPAIRHGAARFVQGKIVGEDAHGARPHLNTNAIQVGAAISEHLSAIQINPLIPHSAKLTSFHAGGESANIIPGNATFSIDLRAQTNEAMTELIEKVKQIAKMLATYYQIDIQVEDKGGVAAAVIHEEAVHIMEKAIETVVGKEHVAPIIPTVGGDDFHYYTIKRPQIKATMLGIGCDLTPGLHHPNMTFHYDAIPAAIEILASALLYTVEQT